MNRDKNLFLRACLMICVAIALNVALGQLTIELKLPLYLDTIGTILIGIYLGGWAGGITGFLTNVVWTGTGLFPQAVAWVGAASLTGILADFFYRSKYFTSIWKAMLGGVISGSITALISAPVAAYVYGGVTGTGTDFLVNLFTSYGLNMLGANMAQGAVSDPLDKLLSFSIAFLLLQILPFKRTVNPTEESNQGLPSIPKV